MKRLWHQVSFNTWMKNWQLKYKVLPFSSRTLSQPIELENGSFLY
jgi:hypothetical protein